MQTTTRKRTAEEQARTAELRMEALTAALEQLTNALSVATRQNKACPTWRPNATPAQKHRWASAERIHGLMLAVLVDAPSHCDVMELLDLAGASLNPPTREAVQAFLAADSAARARGV